MDKLSGFASKLGGGSSSNSGTTGQQPGGQAQNPQQEDYLDKGLDSLESKFGGGKLDSTKMRSTNEKITDTARQQFEKGTGQHVPEKFSN